MNTPERAPMSDVPRTEREERLLVLERQFYSKLHGIIVGVYGESVEKDNSGEVIKNSDGSTGMKSVEVSPGSFANARATLNELQEILDEIESLKDPK